MLSVRMLAASIGVAAMTAVTVLPTAAEARTCTRLGFSVNDFGKAGPTRDAKRLLDSYIARWTAEKGIKKYRTGRKTVKCELYLDLIVVDEHTCKATASVCWNGPPYKVRKTAG